MPTQKTCPSGRTSCTPFDCVCDDGWPDTTEETCVAMRAGAGGYSQPCGKPATRVIAAQHVCADCAEHADLPSDVDEDEPAGTVGLVPGDAAEENVKTVAALVAATKGDSDAYLDAAAAAVEDAQLAAHKAGVMAERARIVAWIRETHPSMQWMPAVIESGEYLLDTAPAEVPHG